jgi:uncharacterized protein DUF5681
MNKDHDPSTTIGYCNPPVETRFKKGVSGNPRGRPKGRLNLKLAVHQAFTRPVLVRAGLKTRRITSLEAIAHKQMERAIKGNDRAAQAVFKIATQLGLLREHSTDQFPDLTGLDDDELRLLGQLVQKIRWRW